MKNAFCKLPRLVSLIFVILCVCACVSAKDQSHFCCHYSITNSFGLALILHTRELAWWCCCATRQLDRCLNLRLSRKECVNLHAFVHISLYASWPHSWCIYTSVWMHAGIPMISVQEFYGSQTTYMLESNHTFICTLSSYFLFFNVSMSKAMSLPERRSKRVSLTYVWPTFDLRLIYVWPTFDLRLIYVWFTFDLRLTYVWPTFDLRLTYVWPTFDLRLTYFLSHICHYHHYVL